MTRPIRASLLLALLFCFTKITFAQGLPPVPVPAGNPITPAKRVLGKILFWDEQLSSNNQMACGTCHLPETGGNDSRNGLNPGPDGIPNTADDIIGSFGIRRADNANNFIPDPVFGFKRQVTGRIAPSMINAAFIPEMFWDGRAGQSFDDPETGVNILPTGGGLENQAIGPPLSNAEMGHDNRDWPEITAKLTTATPLKLATNIPPDMAAALSANPTYPMLFQAAFGSPQVSAARIAMAIATYERTLISDQSPFDLFLAGNMNALTPAQFNGLQTFNGAGKCNLCHSGALTTDNTFRNIGVRPPAEDAGRMNVTGLAQDLGRFKVPSLRNVGLRSRFMHNGELANMGQVLFFYIVGGNFNQNVDPIMATIFFPPFLFGDLIDFLNNALTDPRVANKQFPFDRPTLRSEVVLPGSNLLGTDLSGSGGITPKMTAVDPANIGNPDYRLGLRDALGGTTAYLIYSDVPAAPGTSYFGLPFTVDPLDASFGYIAAPTFGTMAGDGYATLAFPIPNDPSLVGFTRYVQWLVVDPMTTSTLGYSTTRGAKITVF